MGRSFTEKDLLIASGNQGKVKEIADLLSGSNITIRSLKEFDDIIEPEETGKTFEENAILKAAYYGKATGLPALADDSGLSVPALDNAPGIYSARWAGERKDFSVAMGMVEDKLKASNKNAPFSAFFSCALALYWPEDDHIECVEGQAHGQLTFPPRGDKGFGYDPIFIPEGHDVTFAEMNLKEKKKISHRTNAFKKLISICFD
jgi:XTP/dITP diphosphohydrolase